MSCLPSNEFLDPIFKKEDLIEAFKVVWFVINNFFVSFETSSGCYNLSQNTSRLINEIEKCVLSFMESVIIDFIQLLRAMPNFFFIQEILGTRLCVHSISFGNSCGTSYVLFIVTMI